MRPLERVPESATRLRPNSPARTLLVALGFATLFSLWIIKPAVEPQQDALYHWSASVGSFFLPATIDFLTVWLILVVLLLVANTSERVRAVIWGGLLLFTPWFVIQCLHFLSLTPALHELCRILFFLAALGTLCLAFFWRSSFAPLFHRVVNTASTILVFVGFFGILLLSQLAYRAWQARNLIVSLPVRPAHAVAADPHRIIWIVFDELSYQQTFEHRFPGLELPAFDALASTATNFTHAQTFDIYTQIVLPGLLAGQAYDDIKTVPPIELSVHSIATGKWQTFDQHDTVFQDALNAGYSTAIVGWFNPYCRLLPAVVDNCYWSQRLSTNLMSPSSSLLANIVGPIKIFGWMVLSVAPKRVFEYGVARFNIPLPKAPGRPQQVDDLLDLTARSNNLLRDPSYDFLLLHLPVPHPFGIYNRHTGQLIRTGPSSYVNNLALADKCLANIRRTLEQTGQWNSSTVVVMGDHGWRTVQLWKTWSLWSPEDIAASNGGQYDPRPGYLIKLPNQTTGTRIDTPFQTVNTRKFFDALMAHQINSPADLATWAQATH